MQLDDKTNLLLKDFPERLEEDQLYELLAENISISEARNETKAKRKNVLQTLLQDWFFVNSYCGRMYDLFYDTFYQTYRWRHQDNFIPLLNAIREWYDNANKKGYTPSLNNDFNVDGFSIIGISGVGKTHCTRKILRKCFPQLIQRENTVQITYLLTNCVSIGSMKALLVKFLSEVDRLIGSSYVKDYVNRHNSVDKLEAIVASVGVRHYIGIWIIDEVHHLKDVHFRSAEQIINFLKNITAVIGMPIVFIGTPEARSILAGNFQVGRRAEGNGSIFWDRYKRQNQVGDQTSNRKVKYDDEWNLLLTSLWKRQVLKQNGELTEELKDAYYATSQGIMKRLLSIHNRAQIIAMDRDVEKLTPEFIYEAKEYFQFTNNMIDALNSEKNELISQYPDLSMKAYNLIEFASTRKLTNKEIVHTVLESDLTKEEIVVVFSSLIKKKTGKAELEGTMDGVSHRPKKDKVSKQKGHKATGDLIEKIEGKTSADELYETMKRSGMIGLDGKI